MIAWLPRFVARVPATVHTKLLVGFLAIVMLLIIVGAVGLAALNGANRRADELVKLQQKIAAYRQIQHDTTAQLYNVASALLVPEERTLEATLRQLNQFGYDVDRLQFVAKDEMELLALVQENYERFVKAVTHVVELIRLGKVAEGRELQLAQASPLAERLERLTNELVNKAESDIVASMEANQKAYLISRWTVIGFAVGSIGLALLLGYAISLSLIDPVQRMEARLQQIALGDFSQRVEVTNRDELGALAAHLNRMNQELGRLYQQLKDVSRHKSQFLANMSHELRTPLNAILGYNELLLDGIYGDLAEKQREVIERIQSNSRHLLSLINDVLDIAKIEAGQLTITVEDYALPSLIQSVVAATESLARAKGLELHATIETALPVGRGDERRLTQVIMNLVGNAIKFTDHGVVEITARLAGEHFEIGVRDTGPGIASEYQEKIFDEFQQVDSSSTRKKGGTGLGLAISKRIVEMHGGKISVESAIGHGSTFRIILPVQTVPVMNKNA